MITRSASQFTHLITVKIIFEELRASAIEVAAAEEQFAMIPRPGQRPGICGRKWKRAELQGTGIEQSNSTGQVLDLLTPPHPFGGIDVFGHTLDTGHSPAYRSSLPVPQIVHRFGTLAGRHLIPIDESQGGRCDLIQGHPSTRTSQ